ncbi:MAG: cytochrome c [Proteobacteria bacterium]|nr:cytochrome c [Pseudomonadota bacterium]
MRYKVPIAIAVGLFIGIIGTVMTLSALRSGPHMTEVLMHMQDFHMDALDANVKANRCAVTDSLPHLQTLRALSNDLEPVFLPIDKESDFRQKASDLRAELDAALAAPPTDCVALRTTMSKIGRSCKGCHQEFRN